jgi:hypothetical protein
MGMTLGTTTEMPGIGFVVIVPVSALKAIQSGPLPDLLLPDFNA